MSGKLVKITSTSYRVRAHVHRSYLFVLNSRFDFRPIRLVNFRESCDVWNTPAKNCALQREKAREKLNCPYNARVIYRTSPSWNAEVRLGLWGVWAGALVSASGSSCPTNVLGSFSPRGVGKSPRRKHRRRASSMHGSHKLRTSPGTDQPRR